MIDSQLKYFIKQNLELIREGTAEAWDQIYRKYPPTYFTQTLLDANINPALVLEYIPKNYMAYDTKVTSFSITNNCTYIDSGAFAFCSNLQSIMIPQSVTSIGDQAFDTCKVLSQVVLPKNLVALGNMCFFQCLELEKIEIPDTVSTIGYSAFASCMKLNDFILGSGIKVIGESTFADCYNLKQIKYKGIQDQFKAIIQNNKDIFLDSNVKKIICNDGVIDL